MSRSRRAIAICFGLLLACAKNKATPDSTAAPIDAPAAASPDPGPGAGAAPPGSEDDALDAAPVDAIQEASIDELKAELDAYEVELRAQGVKLRGYPPGKNRDKHSKRKKTTTTPATTPVRDRCTQVCELATAVCGLKDRICGLASVHQSEAEYTAACERAERDCARASEACDACS